MRTSSAQRQRTKDNPLNLGSFSQTSLRCLKGTLGPKNQLIGYKDTSLSSNGGFGGGTYNHWFKINLQASAWIITVKGEPRPKYIQVSAFDLDQNPIQGRAIFDADSVTEIINGNEYYPYLGHVMGAQSDLYNFYNSKRLDKGDDRYFSLPPGNYLLCISTTRNEPLDYTVGLVIEIQALEFNLLLEDGGTNKLIYENEVSASNTITIGPVFTSNYSLPANFNGYTSSLATINSGVTLTIPSTSTWFISASTLLLEEDYVILDTTENYTGEDEHQHSLAEWTEAWNRDHQQDDKFPNIFLPLVTTS